MPNITPPGRCGTWCGTPSPLNLTAHRGDVRKCEHGKIWLCYSNSSGKMWCAAGFWRQLHPIFDYFTYLRAAAALEEHQPPTIRKQPPPPPPRRPTRKQWKD